MNDDIFEVVPNSDKPEDVAAAEFVKEQLQTSMEGWQEKLLNDIVSKKDINLAINYGGGPDKIFKSLSDVQKEKPHLFADTETQGFNPMMDYIDKDIELMKNSFKSYYGNAWSEANSNPMQDLKEAAEKVSGMKSLFDDAVEAKENYKVIDGKKVCSHSCEYGNYVGYPTTPKKPAGCGNCEHYFGKVVDDMSSQQIKVIASKMCDWYQSIPPRLEFGLEIPHLDSHGPKVTPCSACLGVATDLFYKGYLKVKVDPSSEPVPATPNGELLLSIKVISSGKVLALDPPDKQINKVLVDIEQMFSTVPGNGCLMETVLDLNTNAYNTNKVPSGVEKLSKISQCGKLIVYLNSQLQYKYKKRITQVCYVRDNDGTLRIDVVADKSVGIKKKSSDYITLDDIDPF